MTVAKKNAAYYLAFPALDSAAPETYVTGESIADTGYYKDGAGAWTSLAITDTVSEIGSTGVYEIDLTASEMNHDKVLIKLTSTNMADDMVMFDLRVKLTDDLQDLTAAQVNTEVDTGITDADLSTAANLATVDTVVDSILAYFTTAMTESYAADGAEVTLPQGVYELLSLIGEFSKSGVTMTYKKRDGSTTAFTSTLDDADTPINHSRAT